MSNNDFATNFRSAVANMLAKRGEAFSDKDDSWGDSRGARLPEADWHMKECGAASMDEFEEDYSWGISDTYNRDDSVGMRAFLTCNCGEVEHVSFIVEGANLSTVLNWLLTE